MRILFCRTCGEIYFTRGSSDCALNTDNLFTLRLFLFISLTNQEIGFKFSVSHFFHLQLFWISILPGMLESLKWQRPRYQYPKLQTKGDWPPLLTEVERRERKKDIMSIILNTVPAADPLQFHLVISTFHLITQLTSTHSMFSLTSSHRDDHIARQPLEWKYFTIEKYFPSLAYNCPIFTQQIS